MRRHPPLQQPAGGNVADDVDRRHQRQGCRREQPGRDIGREHRGQETDHRQPLPGVDSEGQGYQPGAGSAHGATQARPPCSRAGRVCGVCRPGGTRVCRCLVVGRDAAPQPQGHHQGGRSEPPPPCRPAKLRHHPGPEQQCQRSPRGHVSAPQAHHRAAPRRAHQPHDQARCRQGHHQEAQAFERAQDQQHGRVPGPSAGRACSRQQQQTTQHAAAQAEAIRAHAQQQPQQHARELHHRQQEPCLQQTDLQCVAQHGQGRRQLAHMQRATDTRQQHHQFGGHPPAGERCHAVASSRRSPVSRICSRTAKRSVMPAM